MSEASEANTEQLSHPDEVRLRCHKLIDRIAKRPGSAKLLQLAEKSLTLYANYKKNRSYER
ncbi:hypothetical protein [Leptolyngbya sp. FACHB-17]|uniref:hypothetical protein n=1 Tax=unclassified Leptolyngbya TaxID=2650499 RepID=UPI001681A611|nr:hypothetical protein [Leptolyngbya sp. FACHB-17]MBD2081783.1 hypothetical protein [Leptolyngbya sp. FACHB-17]